MAEENKQETPATDEIGKKLDLADSWLTKFGLILKKHWGKLLLIGFGYLVYWFLILPPEEPAPVEEQYQEYVDDSSAYYEDTPADSVVYEEQE